MNPYHPNDPANPYPIAAKYSVSLRNGQTIDCDCEITGTAADDLELDRWFFPGAVDSTDVGDLPTELLDMADMLQAACVRMREQEMIDAQLDKSEAA